MAVNDTRVVQFIIDAMTRALARGEVRGTCGRLELAFRDLQARRQVPGASLDMDLAAAEHYLFARVLVCSGQVSSAQMQLLVVAYDVKKLLDEMRGDPNDEAATDNPVSPPDNDVIRWGLTGAMMGSDDHDRFNSSVDPPIWCAVEDILGSPVTSVPGY